MTLQLIGSVFGFGIIVAIVFYGSMALEREAEKLKIKSRPSKAEAH